MQGGHSKREEVWLKAENKGIESGIGEMGIKVRCRIKMESNKTARIMLLVLALLGTVWTAAAVDQLISLQGKITLDGTPVDDGNLVVTIYNAASGGTLVFNSTTNFNNAIQDGYFDVMLGSITTLDLNYNQYYWLDVKVNSQDINWLHVKTGSMLHVRTGAKLVKTA
jgi:hypothetical protein